jgi:hypothetical protein
MRRPDYLSYRGLTIWEVGGTLVALAGNHRPAVGVVRVGPVFTPREQRPVSPARLPARGGPGHAGLQAVYLHLTDMYLSSRWKAMAPEALPLTTDSLILVRLPDALRTFSSDL